MAGFFADAVSERRHMQSEGRRAWEYLWTLPGFFRNFAVTTTVSAAATALGALYPFLFASLIQNFRARLASGFLEYVGLFLLLQIVQTACNVWTLRSRRLFDLFSNRTVILQFYRKILSLPLATFARFHHSGEIYQRVIDAMELNHVVADVLARLTLFLVRLLVLLGVIVWIHPPLSLALALLSLGYGYIYFHLAPTMRRYQEATFLSNSPLTSALFDGINKIRTIKALAAEERILDVVGERLEENLRSQKRFIDYSSWVGLLHDGVIHLLRALIWTYIVWWAAHGGSLASALSLIFLVNSFFDPFQGLLAIMVDLSRSFVVLERYRHVLEEPSEMVSLPLPPPDIQATCSIVFDQVSFGYNSTPVLDSVTLDIPAGKRVALVGRSGAGKSTILNLAVGFYRPQQGTVRINGVNLADLDLQALRRQMGVVLQDEYIFEGTLRQNVCIGVPHEVSDEEVCSALRQACLWDRFSSVPEGLDTTLHDNTLSGGELQRLTLARAFLRNPSVLLLDEPTSSLDMETESYIQEAMDTLLRKRTSLIIAHRLSTIMKSDWIYVIHEGRVVEQGTHQTLLQTGGHYSRLYRGSVVG